MNILKLLCIVSFFLLFQRCIAANKECVSLSFSQVNISSDDTSLTKEYLLSLLESGWRGEYILFTNFYQCEYFFNEEIVAIFINDTSGIKVIAHQTNSLGEKTDFTNNLSVTGLNNLIKFINDLFDNKMQGNNFVNAQSITRIMYREKSIFFKYKIQTSIIDLIR